jgi:hypothetical protein
VSRKKAGRAELGFGRPEREQKPKQERPEREGRTGLLFYVPNAAHLMLLQIGIDEATEEGKRTNQEMLCEALNDFFTKHGKPPIA